MKIPVRHRYSGPALLGVVTVFILINIAARPLLKSARLDLTNEKLHTLSAGTRSILAELPEGVGLTLYWSATAARDLVGLKTYATRVRELLEAYETLAGGRLTLQVVDPRPFSEEEDDAVGLGLTAAASGDGEAIYFGLAGEGPDGTTRTIPFLQPERERFLEYDVSRLVHSLVHPDKPVVGLLTTLPMNGGATPLTRFQPAPPWMITEQIREQFDLRFIPLEDPQIPDDLDVLMVVHPRPLREDVFYAIDQFVLAGGRALFFIDPHSEAESAGHPSPLPGTEGGVDVLLGAWGLSMPFDKVVGDRNIAQQVTWQGRFGVQTLPYVPWLAARGNLLARDEVVTSQLAQVNLATAGALDLEEGGPLEMTPLITTTGNSMLIDSDKVLIPDPPRLIGEFASSGREMVLAARLTGRSTTAFPGGPPASARLPEDHQHLAASTEPVAVIVVADSDLLQDRFWVNVQNFFGQRIPVPMADNGSFVLNALDQLGGSADLITIRGRASAYRPFDLVARISTEAEARYRSKERELIASLDETETRLADLQALREDPESPALTPDQEEELQRFRDDKVRIRKELRNVRFRLRQDIDRLEALLKFVNIGLVPLLIGFGAAVYLIARRPTRKPAAR